MFKLEARIQRLLNDLTPLLNKTSAPITGVQVRRGKLSFPCDVTALDGFVPYAVGDVWSEENFDTYALFRFQMDLPQTEDDTDLYLHIATNQSGGHNMVRPQMLLMVGNEAVQGVDTNHELVRINEYAGQKGVTFYLYAYSDYPKHTPYGGWVDLNTTDGVRLYLDLHTRDKTLTAFYHSIRIPFAHLAFFDKDSYEYTEIINGINEALCLVDFRYPQSEGFYESVKKANDYIENTLYGKARSGYGKATLVGHTHIDLAWLWRYEHTMDKVLRSFATEVKLLQEYDEHRFMSSQAQLYDYVKTQMPSLYEKIRQLVKEGRWEIEGAMWCEPDMNLVSGESIVRQILYGKRFFKEEFGVDCRLLWLPDVFGYTAALPQILHKAGVKYFMTSKLGTNDKNPFPYDTFTWKGIDGSEVFAHCTTYLPGAYCPDIEKGGLLEGSRRYKQKGINQDILTPFGFSDGGGGVTADQLECIRRMKKGIPGFPEVQIGTAGEYFDRLSEKVTGNKRLPCWRGEIYLENHRGTYTSMARIKQKNRQGEFLYANAEWLWALANCFEQKPFPKATFDDGMKKILLNQFHDVLPGSSLREVYEDADALYEQAFATGKALCADGIRAVPAASDESKITVFNPYSEAVSGYVTVGNGYYYAEAVPAKGYRTYAAAGTRPTVPLTVADGVIESRYYRIRLSEQGEILGLYDKEAGRECFVEGAIANRLRIFEDRSRPTSATGNEDNWNIEVYYTEREFAMPAPEKAYILQADEETVTLRTERRYMDSTIRQDMVVYARSPRIDFKTEIDWKECCQVLKAEFPVNVNATRATYEIQFGYVERPTVANTSWDEARFEVCGHKWADIADGGYGMALLNDCKYGHSANGSTLSLTLLRCGCSPNPNADKEHHSFTYSILPHRGDIRQAGVVKEAYLLNNPLFAVGGMAAKDEAFSLFACDGAVLDTVKPAEDGDGLVLRIYEPYNCAQTVTLSSDRKIARVQAVNLMEEPMDGPIVEKTEQGISFGIKPFEIVTLKVWLR